MPFDSAPTVETRVSPRAKLLDKAIAILERDGWTQHRYHDEETGAFCVLGALQAAGGRDFRDRRNAPSLHAVVYWPLTQRIAQSVGASNGDLASWNDASGRTKGEVIAALRHVRETM